MREKTIRTLFKIVENHPSIEWGDTLVELFTLASRMGDTALMKQISKRSRKKPEDYAYKSEQLCACCYDYVLSTEEIQDFPLIQSHRYIKASFQKALGQRPFNKKRFLLCRLLNELAQKSSDVDLILDMWLLATDNSTDCDFCAIEEHLPKILNDKKRLAKFLKAMRNPNEAYDSLLQDAVLYFMDQGQFEWGYFLSAKLSSYEVRLEVLVEAFLLSDSDIKKDWLDQLKQLAHC